MLRRGVLNFLILTPDFLGVWGPILGMVGEEDQLRRGPRGRAGRAIELRSASEANKEMEKRCTDSCAGSFSRRIASNSLWGFLVWTAHPFSVNPFRNSISV